MIVGGFAGVIYGSTLVTRDVDLCLLLSPAEIARLRQVLERFHPVHRMTPSRLSFIEEPRDITNINNLYLDTDLGVVDLLSEIKGVGNYVRVLQEAQSVALFGHDMKIISITDLIASKKAMGREKDLIAVRELEEIQKRKS